MLKILLIRTTMLQFVKKTMLTLQDNVKSNCKNCDPQANRV